MPGCIHGRTATVADDNYVRRISRADAAETMTVPGTMPSTLGAARMSLSLDDFLSWMEEFEERVPLEMITRKLGELDIGVDQVREYVRFSAER